MTILDSGLLFWPPCSSVITANIQLLKKVWRVAALWK